MAELSKLQIRAKVLSVISEIKTSAIYNVDLLNKFKFELEQINDRSLIFDIFIKEFVKMSEKEYSFCSLILKELVPADYIEEKTVELLKSSSYSDETKYKFVQLLRITGNKNVYDSIPQYFENPEELMDKETQSLLRKAIYNPESMIDFLDFLYSVKQDDKELLLTSLGADYSGDELANIIYPVLYGNFEDDLKIKVTNIIAETKSSLAIEPLNYIIEVTADEKLKKTAATALKKLTLAGASREKADNYFKEVLKSSSPDTYYTTIPDGAGNQAILSIRNNNDGTYIFIALVVNDTYGIVDCFGFYGISENETERIIEKFYKSEGKYKISPQYAKSKIDEAVNLTIKQKRNFPYEFICWNVFFRDISADEINIDDFIDNLETEKETKNGILETLTKDYTLRWYISTSDNEKIKELISVIYNLKTDNIKTINNTIKEFMPAVWSKETINIWRNRIKNLIYILNENNKVDDAVTISYLLKNDNLFELFKQIIMQRSVFNNFTAIRENLKTSAFTANIFTKKNKKENVFYKKETDAVLNILKKGWFNE